MADNTHIEWTDATWNPIVGCSVVSPGCTNCYAMTLAGTRLKDHPTRAGLTTPSKAGPVWNGKIRFNPAELRKPLSWRRPRRIFVCAHGDLFHEAVTDDQIDQVFAVMALSPQHTFQVLTKRAARMRAYLSDPAWSRRVGAFMDENSTEESEGWFAPASDGKQGWLEAVLPLPNVWLGVSAEDQTRADERVPELILTPAAVRFVSIEPALSSVDLTDLPAPKVATDDEAEGWRFDALSAGEYYWFRDGEYTEGSDGPDRPALDWVIVGGESGPGARPMHPDWARQIRDACAAAEVAFFFKQWGEWAPGECGCDGVVKTERTADWFDDRWTFGELTPAASEGLHIDDEPTVYRFGKRRAGRLLDGVEHDAMPEARP